MPAMTGLFSESYGTLFGIPRIFHVRNAAAILWNIMIPFSSVRLGPSRVADALNALPVDSSGGQATGKRLFGGVFGLFFSIYMEIMHSANLGALVYAFCVDNDLS
jgi:hypothetical protein